MTADLRRRARLSLRAHDRRIKFGPRARRGALLALARRSARRRFRRSTSRGTNGKGSVSHARGALRCARRAARGTATRRRTWSSSASASWSTACRSREDVVAMWTERLRPLDRWSAGPPSSRRRPRWPSPTSRARGAEVAVVEVGLGGRLDSTNVVAPLVGAVTRSASTTPSISATRSRRSRARRRGSSSRACRRDRRARSRRWSSVLPPGGAPSAVGRAAR